MRTDHTVLSLDPMYSPLHEKIAQLTSVKKYAVTSCVAKRIYLPSFRHFLAVGLIDSVTKEEAKPYQAKVATMQTYHHAYAYKIEGRTLSNEELNYMARFYVALKSFITDKGVSLVLVHNESRWYHSVAVTLCRELGIPYLVTEQGLIRPHTTVIDPQGCNANSKIEFDSDSRSNLASESKLHIFNPTDKHDSIKSMFFFFIFLVIFTLERANYSQTVLRYMHNNYSLRKYTRRIFNKVLRKRRRLFSSCEGAILLLLQLENDSQFLLHSQFYSNQQVIDLLSQLADENGCNLAVKCHPLDEKSYTLSEHAYIVDGEITELSDMASVVFTINSSASIDVLKTKTPLILLGESIYNREGVAQRYNPDEGLSLFNLANLDVSNSKRKLFLSYLRNQYLVRGAGYSFCSECLRYRLEQLLE
ncbi:phosphoribosylamine--glycine ligase [Vibrio sinaloensis]|uniref:Phosphoribosylamine--glycine ligase n=1 Tax=Photobacterium sp. (strain ATCC 43367) TaxID=379097 RepID=A0A0A5HSF7_PHOS4|nr:phosphoribosylamine--glycine ligase [Vibrio sinaloensis]KGY07245.1 phosphoribosylamine--glycine ligase [Vibrio sinaloensis]